MAINFTDPAGTRQRELPEKVGGGAKVPSSTVPKAEPRSPERQLVGRAIDGVRLLAKLSLKQFAARLGRDDRQVARWIDGSERPQFDVILAVPEFQSLLVQSFAEVAGEGVSVTTSITIRRSA